MQALANIIEVNSQHYQLTGELNFVSVPHLLLPAITFIKQAKHKSLDIDLAKATLSNSAALALLLEMKKQAEQINVKLNFINLPDSLKIVAKLYGVDSAL